MGYPRYKENRMVEATPGQCSIAAVMWVLNYFWYTDFTKRDTWEMMQIMKKWAYRWNQDALLTEEEIALRLAEHGFDIKIFYSTTEEKRRDFVEHPTWEKYKEFLKPQYHKYVKGDYRVDPNKWAIHEWHRNTVTDTSIHKKLLQNKNVSMEWSSSIGKQVKAYQNDGALFILWLDSYVLHKKEKPEWAPLGWHIVVTTGIEGGQFKIFDPGPPLWNGYLKSQDVVEDAIKDRGDYMFILVKERNAGAA